MFNATDDLLLRTLLMVTNVTNLNESRHTITSYELSKGTIPENEKTLCYGDLGCYSIDFPWTDNQSRPISHFPIPPDVLNPRYCLYTRKKFDTCEFLNFRNPQTITNSTLVASHKTYLISHGFLENGFKPWIKLMMRRLLQRSDCNVIAIDWHGGSSPPYTQAVANIRLVGAITARLIHSLHKLLGVKTEYIHYIGHSLGAHLGGYAGNILQTEFGLKLGRITGLDPAEPHFDKTDPLVRLDHTDAIFVDIIHTDAARFIQGGFGMDEPIGHLDFFPNGGDGQPGCDQTVKEYIDLEDGFVKGMRRYVGCDHVRSYEFFIESIKGNCEFLAIECDSYANFLAGKCFTCKSDLNPDGWMCARMGFSSIQAFQKEGAQTFSMVPKSNRTTVSLYTLTNKTNPYCNALYKVTLVVSNSKESIEHRGEVGMFSIKLDGIKKSTGKVPLFREMAFNPGSSHTQVVGAPQVGRVRSIKLLWVHRVSLNFLTWRFGDPTLYIDRVRVENLEEESSGDFCLYNKKLVISDIEETMRPCDDNNEPQLY